MVKVRSFRVMGKSLRRSSRLHTKDTTILSSVFQGNLGYLNALPMEVVFKIFEYLAIRDLGILAITSKEMRSCVEEYLKSKQGFLNLMPTSFMTGKSKVILNNEKQDVEHFKKLGIMMKRSTCLYPTRQRLKLMMEFLNTVCLPGQQQEGWKSPGERLQFPCGILHGEQVMEHALRCFGRYVHAAIAGWDDIECFQVHKILENMSQMKKNVETVLLALPAARPLLEMYIRTYYRQVYLDQCWCSSQTAFWLTCILKPLPIVYQSKLLFIIYGPTTTGAQTALNWYELVDNTPSSHQEAKQLLHGLARSLTLLYNSRQGWTTDDVISLVEELTDTPEDWTPLNVAILLLLSGDRVATRYMGNKLLNGRYMDLATLVVYLNITCTKFGYDINWLVRIIDEVCLMTDNVVARKRFVQLIPSAFLDGLVFSPSLADREEDFNLYIEAQNNFLGALILRAFNWNSA